MELGSTPGCCSDGGDVKGTSVWLDVRGTDRAVLLAHPLKVHRVHQVIERFGRPAQRPRGVTP